MIIFEDDKGPIAPDYATLDVVTLTMFANDGDAAALREWDKRFPEEAKALQEAFPEDSATYASEVLGKTFSVGEEAILKGANGYSQRVRISSQKADGYYGVENVLTGKSGVASQDDLE